MMTGIMGIMVEKLASSCEKKVRSPAYVDDWMGKSDSTPPISQSNNRERTQSEMKMNIEKTISVLLGQIQTFSFIHCWCCPLIKSLICSH